MSSSSTPSTETESKPDAAKPEAKKPDKKKEVPFNVDALLNCTMRMTHKAWHLFYDNRNNHDFIRQTPLRASLDVKTQNAAIEIQQKLIEAGVSSISREGNTLHFNATFETIQTVIKDPEVVCLDTICL
ncbi:MAG: hypothetical protein AAGI66_06830 [Cyanobacteria bacterium P01_H01_bin.74]